MTFGHDFARLAGHRLGDHWLSGHRWGRVFRDSVPGGGILRPRPDHDSARARSEGTLPQKAGGRADSRSRSAHLTDVSDVTDQPGTARPGRQAPTSKRTTRSRLTSTIDQREQGDEGSDDAAGPPCTRRSGEVDMTHGSDVIRIANVFRSEASHRCSSPLGRISSTVDIRASVVRRSQQRLQGKRSLRDPGISMCSGDDLRHSASDLDQPRREPRAQAPCRESGRVLRVSTSTGRPTCPRTALRWSASSPRAARRLPRTSLGPPGSARATRARSKPGA